PGGEGRPATTGRVSARGAGAAPARPRRACRRRSGEPSRVGEQAAHQVAGPNRRQGSLQEALHHALTPHGPLELVERAGGARAELAPIGCVEPTVQLHSDSLTTGPVALATLGDA